MRDFIPHDKATSLWQRCPICEGMPKAGGNIECPVCRGKLIISLLNGKPPVD